MYLKIKSKIKNLVGTYNSTNIKLSLWICGRRKLPNELIKNLTAPRRDMWMLQRS